MDYGIIKILKQALPTNEAKFVSEREAIVKNMTPALVKKAKEALNAQGWYVITYPTTDMATFCFKSLN